MRPANAHRGGLPAGLPWLACLLASGGCSGVAPPPAAPAQARTFGELVQPVLDVRPVDLVVEPLARTSEAIEKVTVPSNDRHWAPDQAVLARAEIDGSRITLRNIRRCRYRTAEDFDVEYYDQAFELTDLDHVDFLVCPFAGLPFIAHTMLSFGFRDGRYVGVSVEIRREWGEKYSAWKGFLQQYELMYVVAEERDLIQVRTRCFLDDVYLYRTRATAAQAQALFLDVLDRVNGLHEQPEFYNTLTNNCTNNLARHVNGLWPERVPFTWRLLLPGYSDAVAYDLGLLATDEPFPRARQRARINRVAILHRDDPDFSQRIRQ